MKKEESNLQDFARPAPLALAAQYQPGAVVSRALIQKAQGSLTVFAFAQGQGLSEHTAPFDAIVTILEGEALLTVDGQAFRAPAGQTLWFPQGVIHSVHAEQPFKMSLVMIRG